MTWVLSWVDHDKKQLEKVGEWSDDLINEVVDYIKKNNTSYSKQLIINKITEFLPDPIKDALQ